jgi:ABC-type multidrug transport system ATPase subunit
LYTYLGAQTVEETLGYVAELRLSPSLTPEERKERVDRVIEVRGCKSS